MLSIFTTLLLLVARLCSAAPANLASLIVPTNITAPAPNESHIGGIQICTGSVSSDTCVYGVYELNRCYDLGHPFYNNTKTFKLDHQDFWCSLYSKACDEPCTSNVIADCTMGPLGPDDQHQNHLEDMYWDTYVKGFGCFPGNVPPI